MPGLNNPLKEEIFPDFQPRPPLVQHELCLLRRVHIWINAVCNSFAVMERGCSHGHGAWNQRTQMTAVTYVSFVPWCLLQAGILMHLAPAQARLICILHLAEEVSMHSKTVKCWKFVSKWNKTIFFLSSLLLILLECPQQGQKSHVSLLQKDRTWGNRLQQVQEVLSEYEEKFLHFVSDRALVQAAQRGCGVCSEVIQNYLGHDLVQVSLIYQRNWTRWSPEFPSNPCHSSVLWSCGIYGWVKIKKEWIETAEKKVFLFLGLI